MKRMTLPAILAAAVLAFALAGCSQAQSVDEETLKGTWSLDSGSDLGFEAYINFEDDSMAEMILADSWLTGTWEASGTQATLTFDNGMIDEEDEDSEEASAGTTAKLTYSNNKLTLGSSDGSKLVFVKDDSDETKSLFSLDYDIEGEMPDSVDSEEVEYVDEVINPVDPAVSIADDDQFSISVTGKGTDFTGDPCYVLSITNKTDKDAYIAPEDEFTVGDKKLDAGLGDEIGAGETIETQMYFAQDELGGALEALTTTDGVIELLDNESDDVIASYPFHME